MPGQSEMPTPGSNNGATGAVPRREQRRCFRRKVLERGEMVHVELGPTESALLLDVSPKGISVQGKKPLTPGLRLSLRFQLPGSQITLQPTYEVVWAEKSGRVGLKFLYMAEREQRQLEEWMSEQSAAAGDSVSIAGPVVITPLPPNDNEPQAAQPAAAAPVPSPAAAPSQAGAPSRRTGGGGPGPIDTELVTLELEEALARLVQQAHAATHADGAALAIRSEEGVICRASVGDAPDVGMHLNPNSGLSGECFRTGEVVICADAANDSRVDPAVARRLNLRSVLIVPIRVGDATAGLLEVLSSKASAFDAAHLASLSHIVEIAGVLLEDTVAPARPEPIPPVLTAVEKPAPLTAKSEVLETPPLPEPPRSESAEDAAIAGIIELLGPELREIGEAAAKPPVPEPAPKRLAPAMPQPRITSAESLRHVAEAPGGTAARVPVALTARRAALSWLTGRNRIVVLIAAGCLLLVAVAVFGIRAAWSHAKTPNTAPQTQAARSSAPPAAVSAPEPAAITVTPPVPTRPASRTATAEPKKSGTTASEPEQPEVVVRRLPTDTKALAPADPGPSVLPPPLPESNVRAALPRLQPNVATPVPAPAANVDAPTLTGPLRVSGEVMRSRVVTQPAPNYPSFARDAGIQGDVVLGVLVGADGRVTGVRVLSGQQLLAQAAVDAVRRWRYQPYILHGRPIPVDTTVTVRFTIPRR